MKFIANFLMLIGFLIPARANADVPDRPNFCSKTICISLTQASYEIENVITNYEAKKDEETIWVNFSDSSSFYISVSGALSQDECSASSQDIHLMYPSSLPKRGCRTVVVTAMPRSGNVGEFIESTEIALWGLEDFPNGSWDHGIAQRIGLSVSLCTPPKFGNRLVSCSKQ